MTPFDILVRDFQHQQLKHFYIIRSQEGDSFLDSWANDLLLGFLEVIIPNKTPSERKKILEFGSRDLFHCWPKDGKQGYVLSDLNDFFHYVDLRPAQWGHKFIFFHQACELTPILYNKLLKILESPVDHTTIFFLNASIRPVLATIESRAISYTLPKSNQVKHYGKKCDFMEFTQQTPEHELSECFLHFLNTSEVSRVLDFIGLSPENGPKLINYLSKYYTQSKQSYQTIKSFLELLHNYDRDVSLNTNKKTRELGAILQFYEDHHHQ